MRQVAALFVRADSVYKTMPGVDAWDIERDARKWPGGSPVVAHPPCRAWGQLSHMAKPQPDEKDLARWSVAQVRQWGGVLEHPRASRLWEDQGLPAPGAGADRFGGWTLGVSQHWWGHRAEKLTKLYIVGVAPRDIPDMPPIQLGRGTHVISQGRLVGQPRIAKHEPSWRPRTTAAENESTPPAFAAWLVDLARRCRVDERAAA